MEEKKLEFNYMLILELKKMRPFRSANWRFKGKESIKAKE